MIPSSTDPQITTTNYNQPHVVVLATNVSPLGKLLLHLPGTDSNPEGAQEWLHTAAALGYHAIGLKYPNEVSMAALCALNTNLDCYEDVAEETVTGLFYPDAMPDAPKQVRRADSIENRVQKLLARLAAAPAPGNWSQFLDATGGVRWSQVAVSGHSQGGSCALFLAKSRGVDRAVLFATMDWIIFPTNHQPAWFANAGVTPAERIYGFTHSQDGREANGFWQQEPIWADLGLPPFGPITLVELNAPVFGGTHQLTSNLRPGATNDNGTLKYHNSVITDNAAPRLPGGQNAWLPVWTYLLTNVTEQLPASLTLNTNPAGRWQASWSGQSGFSSQLEHSLDLAEWVQLNLPAPEVNAIMSVEIPPYLLGDRQRFFRLVRTPLVTSPVPTEPGFHTGRTFVHGGIARNYYLGVPAGWNASTNWPLMIALPGHGQSIAAFATGQSELRQRASNDGMILVFAEATAGANSYSWFPYDDPRATQPYLDDATFLLDLVNELVASGLNVNTNRIYLAGFSNGGSMTHYLAGRTNHPFAAFAIMESGTAPVTQYGEPYDPLAPDSGVRLPALVPTPWQPRPVLMMNMATSIPWPIEGRPLGPNIFFRGARQNVARWTEVNGHGAAVTNGLGLIEPPTTAIRTNIHWTATGNDRARVAYEDIRPDWDWPTNLIANGWSLNAASRFPYRGTVGTNIVDQRLPAWVNLAYPHTLEPDPASPTNHVRVNSGTMTVEIWRSEPRNRTNEVIFVTLSDGGHQWPNAADKLPFNGSEEVLKFFNAH